ncbi:MAG: hypothetical protein A2571_02240 [Candidatus Vogelbacteria bacterium RIFOXYD1_FULL_44_32]|uniref:Clp R domain-containing protein n=1 Tax=Candidatus Vogelbacteria bacterium RIFOXYD1_FULL_44_32 TaxID=1802438 RepID=A0A1G2QDI5_9BACT|nr:MAG: hypothetical protein A2571_02240 [Candidatus Vogelbacteria bacterium RIFOXYD1_FULL_44_32]
MAHPLRHIVVGTEFYPAYHLESLFSHHRRHQILRIFTTVTTILIIVAILQFFLASLSLLPTDHFFISWLAEKVLALIFIFLPLATALYCLEAFFRSYFMTEEKRVGQTSPFVYEVGHILYTAKSEDILTAFLSAIYGRRIMLRLGLGPAEIKSLIIGRALTKSDLPVGTAGPLTLVELTQYLWSTNKDFSDLLFTAGVQATDLVGASAWVERDLEEEKEAECWWRRDKLEAIPSLGRDMAYGTVYTLKRYGAEMKVPASLIRFAATLRQKEVKQLETTLQRGRETNALLVGETHEAALETLRQLASRIKAGVVGHELEHRRVFVFDTALFLSSFKNKSEMELEFQKAMTEAVQAGNLILVLNSLETLLHGFESMGSEAVALLEPYLKSSRLQIVGIVENAVFQQAIGPGSVLSSLFEKIVVANPEPADLVWLLERAAGQAEVEHSLFFTYQSLVTMIESAVQYYSGDNILDKALDILTEVSIALAKAGKTVVSKADILEFVGKKTNIPLGVISPEEKTKLLDLEKILHERVIGQDEAVRAVAESLRRARAATTNPSRPLGTFLFLGPTGVGKTETAKALAAVFFNDENKMLRLDMSEYQGTEALGALVGSFASGKAGLLSTMLREKPYAVLLLDEFEKASAEVRNLFLQILDEGRFADGSGKPVNARNTIIVATSNAGADYIWEKISGGESTASIKTELIDRLVKAGTYTPELLNRFDAVVVFHPLVGENLQQVAGLMLGKLAERLAKQGLKLIVTPELSLYVAQNGADPKFGARPMNRFIQDKIEAVIAEAIIRDSLGAGTTITITGFATGKLVVARV